MFQIHRLLSKHFGSFLESKTFNDRDKKTANVGGSYIQIRMRVRRPKPLQQNDNKGNSRYVHWSVCLSVCLSFSQSGSRSVCLPSVGLSVHLSLSVSQSVSQQFVGWSISQSVCLPVCLSLCLSLRHTET